MKKIEKLEKSMLDGLTLEFKFGESKGRETYGWGTCTLNICGARVSSCKGGGYDFAGTCLAEWMCGQFSGELQALPGYFTSENRVSGGYYGLRWHKNGVTLAAWEAGASMYLDGGCGLDSMRAILKAIGYSLRSVLSNRKQSIYRLEAVTAVQK
jgi:hypothetical protein